MAAAETPLISLPGHRTGIGRLIAGALTLVPASSLQARRLLAQHVRVLAMEEGDYPASQEAAVSALAIARQQHDTALEMQTLAYVAETALNYLDWPQALENSRAAVDLAKRADNIRAEVYGRFFAALSRYCVGDLEGARPHASAILASAERLRDRFWLANAFLCHELLSRLHGDWRVARDYSDRGLSVSPVDTRLLASRVLMEYELGEFDRGQRFLDQFLEVMRDVPPEIGLAHAHSAITLPLVARITGRADRFDPRVFDGLSHLIVMLLGISCQW